MRFSCFFLTISIIIGLSFSCNRKIDEAFVPNANLIVHDTPLQTKQIAPYYSFQSDDLKDAVELDGLIDSLLLLATPNSDFAYQLFNLNSNASFMPVALDKNDSYCYSQIRNVNGFLYLDILALNSRDLLTIDLKETINNKQVLLTERVSLPAYAVSSFLINDTILANICLDKSSFSLRYIRKNDGVTLKEVPLFGTHKHLYSSIPLFDSIQRISPNGNYLVFCMRHFDKLHIFNIRGNTHYTVTTAPSNLSDSKAIKKFRKTEEPYHPPCYLDVSVTDRAIYALHLSESPSKGIVPTIQVFDWSGNYLCELIVREPIVGILTDEKGFTLYGFCNMNKTLFCYHTCNTP